MEAVGEQGDLPIPRRCGWPAASGIGEVRLPVVDQDRAPAAAADQPAIVAAQRQGGHAHGWPGSTRSKRPIRRRPDPDGRVHAAVTISRPSAGKASAVSLSA